MLFCSAIPGTSITWMLLCSFGEGLGCCCCCCCYPTGLAVAAPAQGMQTNKSIKNLTSQAGPRTNKKQHTAINEVVCKVAFDWLNKKGICILPGMLLHRKRCCIECKMYNLNILCNVRKTCNVVKIFLALQNG